MSPHAARRALRWLAALLIAGAYVAVWFSDTACGLLAAAAGACVVVGGLLRYIDDDCGYSDTVYGPAAVYGPVAPAPEVVVTGDPDIDALLADPEQWYQNRRRGAMWPPDAGAPE